MSSIIAFVLIVLIPTLLGIVLVSTSQNGGTSGGSTLSTQTTSSTGAGINGTVTGYVTVGPSQPACWANQSCNEDI
ncbi:MAG: hypothetical protein M1368_08620 [Thaumarchaeota archaeon]|nr:hypothetical protein [Nitrososphaerota archaeon]